MPCQRIPKVQMSFITEYTPSRKPS
jgi:hypothetical protein